MDDFKRDKVKKFINDKAMSEAIYNVLLDSFLKDRPNKEVYILAASRLAIDFLHQAWKELEKFQENENSLSTPPKIPYV